jgi:hypothetical protein
LNGAPRRGATVLAESVIVFPRFRAYGAASRLGKQAMASQKPARSEERGRVLPFAPRGSRAASSLRPPAPGASPVEDVGKYAKSGEADDYRHRMKTNAIALLFVALLVVCGYWLADTMAQMRRNQDCVLSGRPGCTPVNVPPQER